MFIEPFKEFYLVGTKDNQVHLFDMRRHQTLVIFHEFLSIPISSVGVRSFCSTIIQGRADGFLTFYEFDESQIKKQQTIQQQSKRRVGVTQTELINFELFGNVVITLQKGRLELLMIDEAFDEFVKIKVFLLGECFVKNLVINNKKIYVCSNNEIGSIGIDESIFKIDKILPKSN